MLKYKTITFPLEEAQLIKNVKTGQVPVQDAFDMIEETLSRVDDLLQESDLSETSDVEFMNEVILECLV